MASNKLKKLGVGTLSMALLTAFVAACAPPQTETDPQAEQPTTEQPADPGAVTREDVAEDYEELIGQTVTIRGDIDERLADNVVRMGAGNLFGGEDIIVVLPDNFVLPTEEGDADDIAVDRIQVTGQVQRFTAAEAQQYNIPEDEIGQDEDRPMILADTAALSPDTGELSDNPELFFNQTVAVEGDLEEIGPNAYRLGGGLTGGDILVISDQPLQQLIDQGDDLVITGEARQFDIAEFQQQYNWDAELQQEITENYGDNPVIVAQEVFPIEEQ
ncbi:hypothetical protein [Egbenema bharatensis]|uniref:hypothetical protein n=1 Tax=Egbenema bharatensis TaxID=3463334 RepID=UPI003A84F1CE